MLSNSDDKTEIKNVDDIKEHLKTLRNNPSAYKKEFVYPFLGKDIIEDKFRSNKNQIPSTIITEERYNRFCNAYLIKIFLTFLSTYDAEIMLMIYGFLDNFDDVKLGDRRKEYWQYAHTYNSRLQGSKNQDKDNLLRGIENNIIDNLANVLIKLKLDNKQMSNFTDMVFEEFINNKIPEKLALPITDYLQHNDAENFFNEETENTIDVDKQISDILPFVNEEDKEKKNTIAILPNAVHIEENSDSLTKESIEETTDTQPSNISSSDKEVMPRKTHSANEEKCRKSIIFLIIAGTALCILIVGIIYMLKPNDKKNVQEQSSSSIYDSYESSPPVRITFTNGTVVESFESIKVSQDDKGAVTVTIIDDKGNINPLSDSISGNVEDIP